MTRSVIFWTLIFSAIIGILVGFIHPILGVIVFFAIVGPSMKVALIIDVGSGWLKYHHDRQDSRKRKEYESELFLLQREREAQYLEMKRREQETQYLEMKTKGKNQRITKRKK